jgi:large subunit ribosomal protein L29
MPNSLNEQLRVSTEEELQAKLVQAKEELFNLRFQGATGQLESHGRLRAVRKEIARIYTVMRERELGIITLVEDADDESDLAEAPELADEADGSVLADESVLTDESGLADEAATEEAE